MDKYEFNIKVEQIKKMVSRGDYETAMKIADTIDWRRVRNVNILSMVATIYEKNEEYQEAKDILLLAFERAPIGKRLLFKLAELAIKEGSFQEATKQLSLPATSSVCMPNSVKPKVGKWKSPMRTKGQPVDSKKLFVV